jgi:hypothetical protein
MKRLIFVSVFLTAVVVSACGGAAVQGTTTPSQSDKVVSTGDAYAAKAKPIVDDIESTAQTVDLLITQVNGDSSLVYSDSWKKRLDASLTTLRADAKELDQLGLVPESSRALGAVVSQLSGEISSAIYWTQRGYSDFDASAISQSNGGLLTIHALVREAKKALGEV